MLDAMLILSFAMCLLCCVRSLWKDGWRYALVGAVFGGLFLFAFQIFRTPISNLASLGRLV